MMDSKSVGYAIEGDTIHQRTDKENNMWKTWRMLTFWVVVYTLMATGNVVQAESACEQAVPAQHDKGVTLRVGAKGMLVKPADNIARAGQAMRTGQFPPYQKPVLSDKGICHQKPSELKGTVSM